MGVGFRFLLASCTVIVAVMFAGRATPALAQSPALQDSQAAEYEPLTTDNAALQASLDRLLARSAAWRDAVDQVSQTGRRAYIATPNRVRMLDPDGGTAPFDTSVLAEVLPVPDENRRVDVVVVVVNLPLLQKIHRYQGFLVDIEADLDRILAHEIYGHAIPYLLAGHMSGQCPDPLPRQPAAESCAIKRENEVRAQLGLGPRLESGLDSLGMVRSFRHRQVRR